MVDRFWMGKVPLNDDFGDPITDEFIDGRIKHGTTWGFFTPKSWAKAGCGVLGTGYGQRYERQADDRFKKVEG